MKLIAMLMIAFSLLVGCAPNPYARQLDSIPLAKKPVVPTSEAACIAAGQYWTQQGLPGGSKSCAVKTHDSRKICTDSAQCEGSCLVSDDQPVGAKAIGSCSDWFGTFGCHKFMRNGVVDSICAD